MITLDGNWQYCNTTVKKIAIDLSSTRVGIAALTSLSEKYMIGSFKFNEWKTTQNYRDNLHMINSYLQNIGLQKNCKIYIECSDFMGKMTNGVLLHNEILGLFKQWFLARYEEYDFAKLEGENCTLEIKTFNANEWYRHTGVNIQWKREAVKAYHVEWLRKKLEGIDDDGMRYYDQDIVDAMCILLLSDKLLDRAERKIITKEKRRMKDDKHKRNDR